MKKFRLDLSEYNVTVKVPVTKTVDGKETRELEDQTDIYPLRENISIWLRSIGIFKVAEDIAEAALLAREIMGQDLDEHILDGRQTDVLKKCIDRHVELTAEGKANLGGPVHEEAIIRVVKMEEVRS